MMKILEPASSDIKDYYYLRWKVLRKPLGLEEGTEKDDLENQSIHRLVKVSNQVVGVGRLHFIENKKAQIRYMAVEDDFRGKGIGRLIADEFIRISKERKMLKIILCARESALIFYEKLGFIRIQKAHRLENVQHFLMEKVITQ